MKCTLDPSIGSISGKAGNVLYKTFKRPNGKTETRAYFMPKLPNGKYGYERKAPVTKGEQAARNRFKEVAEQIKALSQKQKNMYFFDWKKAGCMYNGKKYATLRGYIMARFYADDTK